MKLKISERRKKENNREYAYRVLRDNIMTMQLLPGETLNEAELAEIFHVSRTPVHEAIIMLKEEMLVEVYPQSGSKVSYININTLKEGYFMRSVLEPEILATLAGSLSQDYVEKIKENLDLQKKVLEEKNEDSIDAFFKLDNKFHQLIYQAGNKSNVWRAVRRVSSHYDRVRYLDAIMSKTDLEAIQKEHEKIFHQLLIGYTEDFDLKKFYDRHLGIYRKNFQNILEHYPEYFGI